MMVDRKNGPVERWFAQVVVEGRKRCVTAMTEAAAKKELRRLLRSVDDGEPIADGNLTLGALLTEWESKVLAGRDISGSTLMRQSSFINGTPQRLPRHANRSRVVITPAPGLGRTRVVSEAPLR